ncbi:MAG: DUF2857 domain-containing protein [Candidatus Accumulibacter sp.]|jgi:hypothetical protein|nr:DUF2857 domain-containing protein [Accumulibacter sp.]
MAAPHLLNQAVVTQALHDLRDGQLRRCLDMGFGEHELEVLKQPALVALLVNACVSWCKVTVDCEVLGRLVGQARDSEREIDTVDRMLRLGGSSEMVCRYYGLTHQEIAVRREIIGQPGRKGRHPTLREAQEKELWRTWKAAVAERHIALDDEMAMLALATDLAESLDASLTVVWATLRRWIARESAGE